MKKRKRAFWKPVAAGFGAMYFVTMGLATLLVKEKFVEDYRRQFHEAAASIGTLASQKEFEMEDEEWDEENRKDYYQSLADRSHWTIPGGAFEISVAFYDEGQALMAQSRDQIGGNLARSGSGVIREYMSFGLDDYLSWEEKEQLAQYQWNYVKEDIEYYTSPNPWHFSIRVSPDERQLWGIYVQKITWLEEMDWDGAWYEDPLTGGRYIQESGAKVDYETGEEMSEGKTYYESDSRIVWQWENPDIDHETRQRGKICDTSVTFPYMGTYENGTYDRWKRWSTSPYLHSYPDREEFSWEGGEEEPSLEVASEGIVYRARYRLQLGMVGDPFSYMEIRMESRPWMDAFDYMKYVYGAGLGLTLACMLMLISAFGKIYDKQKAMEDTRRDFTNAIAHELKTPLGIIRNFAENLQEHTMEEKRDYYLAQIINQTEEMDELVMKMIQVSKPDSEELSLKKEQVSFQRLIQEQMKRFEAGIQEKGIQVEYQENGDFLIEGDREYLAKAVWNLLDNAVDYNVSNGKIRIRIEKNQCIIENTGTPMGEEELIHAFDWFYTGNTSRNKRQGHLGMGLCLANKILGLHGTVLTLENMEGGVRAVIRRG